MYLNKIGILEIDERSLSSPFHGNKITEDYSLGFNQRLGSVGWDNQMVPNAC